MAQQKTDATADKLSADVKALREQIEKLSEGQREIILLRYEVTGQDKRLSDTINRIGDVNTWLTVFGIVFAVIVAAVGIFAFVQAARRAQDEAREWLRANDQNLRQQINEMKVGADAIKAQMITLAQEVKDEAAKHSASMGDAAQEVQTISQRTKEVLDNAVEKAGKPLAPEVQKELHLAADHARGKPEKQYTAEDWNIRAHNAYASQEWEEAARFWGEIPETPGATPLQIAMALFSKGVCVGNYKGKEDEISVYDDIKNRFMLSNDPNLRAFVVKAMVNKGFILSPKEAICVYDDVDKFFGLDRSKVVRKQLARLYGNRGWANYEIHNDVEFLNDSDRALGHDKNAAWLLCNRALALHLNALPRDEVMTAYERAWQVINDPAKWEKLALIDLRAHGRTVRTDSPPVPDDLIEAVAALAKGAE